MYEKCIGEKNGTDNNKKNSKAELGNYPRYDNEGEFFKLLKLNDPTLHNLVTEKVKYFDPAFHSVSPEGFNARLTFLHQCTRQGPTIGASDVNQNNRIANNLAFGRPPVCILRIGDFYYTKIAIKSISIQYDPVQWDLNQEGIGIMPMFADISISFSFLGGSGLSGPIARLQNAVSFNYYANTEVYDNRSEQAEFSNGKLTYFKPFEVNYNLPEAKAVPISDINDEVGAKDTNISNKVESQPKAVNAKAVDAKAVDAKSTGHRRSKSTRTQSASVPTPTRSGTTNETAEVVKEGITATQQQPLKVKSPVRSGNYNNNSKRVICKYIRFGISRLNVGGTQLIEATDGVTPFEETVPTGPFDFYAMIKNYLDRKKANFMLIAYIYYYDKITKQVVDAKCWGCRSRLKNNTSSDEAEWFVYGSKPVASVRSGLTPPLIEDKDSYSEKIYFADYKFVNEKNTRQTVSQNILKKGLYVDTKGRGRIYKK